MQDTRELNKNIEKLNSLLETRISFKRTFLLGVVTGVGSVIGAALIGSLLVSVINSNLDNIPILRDIISTETVQEYTE
jgi:zinc transporter ZupT